MRCRVTVDEASCRGGDVVRKFREGEMKRSVEWWGEHGDPLPTPTPGELGRMNNNDIVSL